VFLADGRVVDQGRHDELLTRNSRYADLVNAYEQAADQPADSMGDGRVAR
jgi:ABC-type transport system involved in cytochrome bd biosynthesis fused ATPase/permease subunit